jgi:hypothetical protein
MLPGQGAVLKAHHNQGVQIKIMGAEVNIVPEDNGLDI